MSGATPAGSAAEPAVQALLDDLVADNPALGTVLGLSRGAERLPSWSAEAVARRVAMLRGHERRLTPLLAHDDPVAAADAFGALQIVRRQLRDLELREVHRYHPGSCLDSLYSLYPLMVRDFGTTADRVAALSGRLAATPGLLEELRGTLQPGLPAEAVNAGVDYADGLLDLAGPTVRGFAESVGQAGALDGRSRDAVDALESFRRFLVDELMPTASPGCAAGRAVIDDLLRWELVLDDEPEDLAAYGREVLQATQDEMRTIAAELGYASSADAVAAAQADTPGRDALVGAYRAAVEAAHDYVVGHGVVGLAEGAELDVRATPEFLRSMLPFAAYDPPGPFAARQLGFYYVTPPRPGLEGDELRGALKGHAAASLATTGVHEAYPGHHLQLTRANLAPTLARRISWIPNGGSLFIEGWAFYCEELMEHEGFLAEPMVRLMRLNDQLWRACRVVIDVELHLGLMELGEAVDYLVDEAHLNRHEAVLECRRYAEEPGQPMSYLLGKREVLRLAAARRSRGATSLREFHDELLDWGSLPPAVIAWGMGLGPRPAAARVSS